MKVFIHAIGGTRFNNVYLCIHVHVHVFYLLLLLLLLPFIYLFIYFIYFIFFNRKRVVKRVKAQRVVLKLLRTNLTLMGLLVKDNTLTK